MSASTLVFTSSWQQFVIGTLSPGTQTRIAYDSNRLPNERSTYNGSPTWSIVAFYRFSPSAPVQQVTLQFEGAGLVPGPAQTVSLGGSFLFATIDVPAEAQSVEMWFLNTGRSGFDYWDSNYGQNYDFRFTAQDIGPVLASVVTSYPTPYSGFNVQLNSVDLAVDSVFVNFRDNNASPGSTFANATMNLTKLTVERGAAVWANGTTSVPLHANITFTIGYTIGNSSYIALNGGEGFNANDGQTVVGDAPAVPAIAADASKATLQV